MSDFDRPEPGWEPAEGFHLEAREADEDWRVASDEETSNWCRHSTRTKCVKPVAIALNRGYRRNGKRSDAWWFYCEEHSYGRWVEGDKVMQWRLVKDAEV